jgi:NADH-quinone oxidoreductase subunit A
MLGQYLPLVVLLALAVVFAAGSFVTTTLLAPKRSNDRKTAPYESGIIPVRGAPERFPVKFFLVAMIFIVFDIEIIFFYPWAIAHREVGVFGLVAVLIFSVAVFESFLYLISNGALEWGPIKRLRHSSPMVSAQRTTDMTIRGVGLEGRDEVDRSGTTAVPDDEREPAVASTGSPHDDAGEAA